MLPDDVNSVIASYHRGMHGDGFVDTFNDLFLASSPKIKSKFRQTDFKHEKLMLRESLLMMIVLSQNPPDVRDELTQLAKRHDRDQTIIC